MPAPEGALHTRLQPRLQTCFRRAGGAPGLTEAPCSRQAMRYLSYLLYPLCIGGAVYSLLNIKYKR